MSKTRIRHGHSALSTLPTGLPELTQVPYPLHPHDFHQFINWANTLHSNIQHVELKEYYDNGSDQCYQLQQTQIDIEQLNNRIESEVEQLFAEYADATQDEQNEIDFAEHIYAILFDHLYAVAEQYDLALLLISNEHPYWMLIPDQTEQIKQLIEAFNSTFSDVELYHYV